jgi:ATP adenylyltransferase
MVAMKQMWAPWRVEYIEMEKPKGCFLCEKPKQDNGDSNYILCRGKRNFVIMNLYPYNPGHLMVAPYRHVANLEDLSRAELHEHIEMVSLSIKALKQAFNPGGFNLGINLGRMAGAGIDDHIHSHIVPRWAGDTNFMPVLSGDKVISRAMAETYQKLKAKFESIAEDLIRVFTIARIQFKTLQLMAEPISEWYGVKLEDMKDILELTIRDEENETEILMRIRDFFSKKNRNQSEDQTPTVRYQNPDRWYTQIGNLP